jgi:hypothetical protein
MTINSADNRDAITGFSKVENSLSLLCGLYQELSRLNTLRYAYERIKGDPRSYLVDPTILETIEEKDIEGLLQQLSDELLARTYRPLRVAECEGGITLRDLVVQVALQHLLESSCPSESLNESEPEKTIKWLAGNIDKGLCRIYALNLCNVLNDGNHERLLERASQRIGDPQLVGLLKEILAITTQPRHPSQVYLIKSLFDIAFEGIDFILQQAKWLGREENFLSTGSVQNFSHIFPRQPRVWPAGS